MSGDKIPIFGIILLYWATAWMAWQPVKGRRLAAYVISLYGVIATAAGALLVYDSSTYVAPGILPLLHLYFMVVTVTVPIYRFADGNVKRLLLPKGPYFLCFAYCVGAVSLFGLLTHLPESILLTLDGFRNESFDEIYRTQRLLGREKSGLSIGNLPLVIANAMGPVVPFLLLTLMSAGRHLTLKCVLAACIAMSLLNWIGSSGRNGLVFFCISIIGSILLFWNLLESTAKRVMIAGSLGIIVLSVVTVLTITWSRFSDRQDVSPMESVLVYSGQPMLHFCEYVYQARSRSHGDMNFPLLRAALGMEFSASLSIRKHIWETEMQMPFGVFYTVFGDFMLDFGVMLGSALFIVVALWVILSTRNGAMAVELHELFLIYVLFLLVGPGIFYFMYKTIGGNLQVLCMVCSYVFFRFFCLGTSMKRGLAK